MNRTSHRLAALITGFALSLTGCTLAAPAADAPLSTVTETPDVQPDDPAVTAPPGDPLPTDLPEANPDNPIEVPPPVNPDPTDGPSTPPGGSTGNQKGRPNIVFITTDDMTYSDLKHMPNVRKLLGGNGYTFPNSLSPHPLCCPARAEFVTGQYGQNNGVHHNTGFYGGYKALIDPSNTVGRWLNKGGYQTAFVGKYLNGFKPDKASAVGWTRWNPTYRGVYTYIRTKYYNDGDTKRHTIQTDDATARYAQLYVQEFSQRPQPFFMWVSALAPHTAYLKGKFIPPIPSDRHLGTFNGKNPATQKPTYKKSVKKESGRFYQQRIESLYTVDDTVKDLVDTLRREGELKNTYIFFTSDNGYLLGEHGIYGKNRLYNEVLNVPLVVRVPGVRTRKVSRKPVTSVDLPVTFADLGNSIPGRKVDGVSFANILKGKGRAWRDTQLIQTGRRSGNPDNEGWRQRGVKAGPWVYFARQESGKEFLFNRKADPYEITNLANLPAYSRILIEMRNRLSLLENCAGTGCNRSFGDIPRVRVSATEPEVAPLPEATRP